MAVSDHMARAVVQAIQEQMERVTFYDVTITVQRRTFNCHRFQLSACSKFFRAMFSSGMKEDLTKTVEIKGIDPNIFSLVIDCIYRAKYVINGENVTSLWHAANQLQIDFLTESCEMFHADNRSKDNCVEVYVNAKMLDSRMLLKLSWELIIKEFEYLRKTETILMLDYDDMLKLVADDALVVTSEDVVIDLIMRWASFILDSITETNKEHLSNTAHETPTARKTTNEELVSTVPSKATKSKEKNIEIKAENILENNRKHTLKEQLIFKSEDSKWEANFREQCLPSLLSAAKMCLVSSTRIQSLTENKLIRGNPKAFAVIMEGLRYQLQPGRRHDYCPASAIHRSSSQLANVTMVVWVQGGQVKMSCRTIDGVWFSLPAVMGHLGQRNAFAFGPHTTVSGFYASTSINYQHVFKSKAVSYENDIYAVPTSGYPHAFKYDSKINTWRQLPAVMSFPRQNTSVIVLDHYIYAVGGDNCAVIERFNAGDEQQAPGSGKWENIGHLTQAVTNTVATTFGSDIFVFGIASDNSSSIKVQRFDTQTMSTYINLTDMSGSCKNMVAIKHEDRNYLLQETGAFWKMIVSDDCIPSLQFLGIVWDFSLELSAAVICNNELLVVVKMIGPQSPREWDTIEYPEFQHVKIIERDANWILNNVIPKTFLKVKEA